MGRTRYLTAIILTFLSLVSSQFTIGREQPTNSSAAWFTEPKLATSFETSKFLRDLQAPQEGQLTTQMKRDIINRLRQRFQEVLPPLKSVRLECNSNMPETLRKAIEPAQGWLRAVDQFGLRNSFTQDDLTPGETETLILDRARAEGLIGRDFQNRVRALTRSGIVATDNELRRIERDRLRSEGYNDQEAENALRELEAVRAEFQKMYDELNMLIWDTLKKAYDKAHECCMKEAKELYLEMMDSIGRQLSVTNQAERVSMEKRNDCLCMIESVSAGQSGAWVGEITHTESFVDDRNETLGSGSRQNKYFKKHDYRAVINLVYHSRSLVAGESSSHIPALVTANGTVDSLISRENRWTSASMDKRQGAESKQHYSGKVSGEEATVEVQIRPDGTYNVTYNAPCAPGSGREESREYTEGTGFPEFQKKDDKSSKSIKRDVCPTQPGVLLTDGRRLGITGQLDLKSTKTISGSKTFDVPLDENPKVNKTITITWKLKRCK